MKNEAKSKAGAGIKILMPALCFLIALILAMGGNAFAIEIGDELIPLGKTTGIKMFSEGAIIVGFSEAIDTGNPAQKAGLKAGDAIISINSTPISSKEDLISFLKTTDGKDLNVTVKRDGQIKNLVMKPVYDAVNDTWRIGAWIRDSVAGIGTITYVDPKTGEFGALGHGITDVDTGKLVNFQSGSVMNSTIIGIRKGTAGEPGELKGNFNLKKDQGVLYSNTYSGVFGRLEDSTLYAGLEAFPTAARAEINEGKAYILSNVDGDKTEKFDIEILRIYNDNNDNSNRDMMIRVTDKNLLNKTGGIVQGMSGSPIIQGGKIVGAVTHVLINDPTRGYAISIENMLTSSKIS